MDSGKLWIGLALVPLASWAGATADSSINAFRGMAVTDPHGLIVQVRQQLDHGAATLTPLRERNLLWGMGTAAINADDEAALTEATLRLDGLNEAGNAPVAAAAAGYLRARHNIANGMVDGLNLALQAAAKVQGESDPQIVAWSRFQLCDAYTLDERAKMALPLCQRALHSYTALGDTWGVADTENDLGLALATLDRVADAVAMYERSRKHFAAIGAHELTVMVGDNLSQMYLKMGRPQEALALSQTSLQHELAAGRISDSLDSRADIARAQAAMGDHVEAYRTIRDTVDRARAAGIQGQLIDLLELESRMAERIGLLRPALAAEREAMALDKAARTPALQAAEVELEQRYAGREKELRIRDLERENHINTLALKAAQAQAAQRLVERERADLASRASKLAAVGLLLLAVLLFLLLRNQRRHSAALRVQALRDPLTGVDNRRAFMQRVDALLADQSRQSSPAHVLMLVDFDHFKQVNDRAGHPVGDRVLNTVAEFLDTTVRGRAYLARIGGEEFAVLYPHAGAESGMRLAEQLRAGVATLALPAEVPMQRVTVSIGVAMFDGDQCHDLSSWMRAADSALYMAKAHGRDRVVASAISPGASVAGR